MSHLVLPRYVEPPNDQRTGMPDGTWHARICHPQWKGDHYALPDGTRLDITIRCPQCHVQMMLATRNHTIAADRTVSPSLVCANEKCTWHIFVRLADWPPAKETL